MDVTSTYKFARVSAQKARDIAREIQGLPVSAALDLLSFTPRKAAGFFAKTMKTALADAENNFELPIDSLIVKSAVVGEGPTFKRFKARARGSGAGIRKRTSHLTVVLSNDVVSEEAPPKKQPKAEKAAAKASTPNKPAKAEEKAASSDDTRVDEVKGLVYDSRPADADDLKQISGVGPKLEEKLNAEGIYTFEQIAAWTDEQVAAFDDLLSFKGRIERDGWIEKAKNFASEK